METEIFEPEAAEPGVAATPENPYLGLHPYGEGDSAYFHGRGRETGELLRRVRREVLTVLFGKSGLGKTSLLRAGLSPPLRQELYLPVPIRLAYGKEGPGLAVQVHAAVAESARAAAVEAEPAGERETLWEYFHRTRFWDSRSHLVTPVLVFDQFEEIFTLGRGDARVQAFLPEIADLIENQVPLAVRARLETVGAALPFTYEKQRFRVVLSLREDFLPQLEDLRRQIPSIARNRFRLKRLDGVEALNAVRRPAPDLVGEEVAAAIVRFVAAARTGAADLDEDLAALEVEPSLLSLVCRELAQRRIERGLPAITGALLAEQREEILYDFYQRSVADIGPGARVFLEERLLTASGFRGTVALDDALRAPGVDREVLDRLVSRRLLRIEERLGIPHVELVHDVLTEIVQESRDRRRSREAQRRRLRRMAALAGAFAGLSVLLGGIALFSLRARDEARSQQAEIGRRLAELYEEQGRQELLRGDWQRALLYLAEAYRGGEAGAPLRLLLGRALEPLDSRRATLEGHQDEVWSIQPSPDGKRVVTASRDGTARIWDAVTGRLLRVLEGHTAAVVRACYSPDGTRIATASRDGTAGLWDAEKGSLLARLEGHRAGVWSVEFSPDGRILTASQDGTARLWDAEGRPAAVLEGHTGPVVSAHFSRNGRVAVTASWDSTAKVWDGVTGQLLETLEGTHGPLLSATFDPTEARRVLTVGSEGTAAIWSLRGLEGGERLKWLRSSEDHLVAASFSPDGQRIVTASRSGKALLWMADGNLIGSLGSGSTEPGDQGSFLDDMRGGPFDPASGTSDLPFDPVTGDLLRDLRAERRASFAAFSQDGGSLLLGYSQGIARIWDLGQKRYTAVLGPVPGGDVLGMAVTAAGDRAVVETADGTVQVWDVRSLRSLAQPSSVAALSRSGDRLLVLESARDARLIETRTMAPGARLRHPSPVRSAAFDSEGKRVLTVTRDGETRIWDAASGRILGDLGRSARIGPSEFESITHRASWHIDRAPDGSLMVARIAGGSLVSWQLRTSAVAIDLHRDRPLAVGVTSTGEVRLIDIERRTDLRLEDLQSAALSQESGGSFREQSTAARWFVTAGFSPDGKSVLATSLSGRVSVWDASSGRLLRSLAGHAGPIWSARFSPNGLAVLTAGSDRTAGIWDVRSAKRSLRLPIPGGLTAADISSDGRRLAAAESGGATVFDLASGRPVAELEHSSILRAIRFDPGSQFLAGGAQDGRVWLWDAKSGRLRPPVLERKKNDRPGAVLSLSFSRDGKLLVSAGEDRLSKVWYVRTGARRARFDNRSSALSSAMLSPDGTRVAAAGQGSAFLWNVATSRLFVSFVLSARSSVSTILFNPSGSQVLTAGYPPEVRLWDAENGDILATLERHESPVCCADFSRDGTLLLTVGKDGMANVWDAVRGKLLATFELQANDPIQARLDAEGTQATVVFADGTVKLFDLPRESRSQEELDRLLRCYVPFRLVSERVLPAEADPQACRQVFSTESNEPEASPGRTKARLSP